MKIEKTKQIGVLILAILVSGCITAENIEQDADINPTELTYDLEITAEVNEHEYYQKVNNRLEITNTTTRLLCSSIVSGLDETNQTTDEQEELKPNEVNLKIYNQENKKVGECSINER